MLISAFQNLSSDPITRVHQTNGSYWERVYDYFIRHEDVQSDCTWNSLSVIELEINKFHGFYNQVGAPSGWSESDKVIYNLYLVYYKQV